MYLPMINRFLSLVTIVLALCACSNPKEAKVHSESTTDEPIDTEANDKPSFNRDSLYADIIGKLKHEPAYLPVIRYLVDSIALLSNKYEYETLTNYLFTAPHKYVTKMSIDSMTLVTMAADDNGEFHYFLLNSRDSIVFHRFSDTYHTIILNRSFRDWNNDGKKEIVEHRQYIGQRWLSTSEFVFSADNNKLQLLFCINLSEENCLSGDSIGYLTTRSYQKTAQGLFYITQNKTYCNCNESESQPKGRRSTTHYTISADSLIKTYGNNTWE